MLLISGFSIFSLSSPTTGIRGAPPYIWIYAFIGDQSPARSTHARTHSLSLSAALLAREEAAGRGNGRRTR